MAQADSYASIFEALAHPARRKILISLHFAGGQMPAGAIAAQFASAWPTITRHLQVLEAAMLVHSTRVGRQRVYSLSKQQLALATDWLGWFGRDPVSGAQTDQGGNHDRRSQTVPAQPRSRQSRTGG